MSDIVALFKALADPTRLRVLKLLGRGELCVCEIAAALDLAQPRLSFHLRILKDAGIVQVRRQERWILYRLNDADLFVRFLLLAIEERVSAGQARLDLKRLAAFGGRGQACLPSKRRAAEKDPGTEPR
ncbi:MAG TPA: metalloregulator ArsR/SmtB family transcription factor [Candidatus Aminicenantes bacterium]|nr:metalloregulator ArsR/SmtB family transcription factor [Candidatus Aminicenantes bacterium]